MIEWSNPWSETTTCFGRLGDYSGGVSPLPIPNREVKPTNADGTASYCGRVGNQIFLINNLNFYIMEINLLF